MSAKAGKRPLRSLTAHEKLEAIRRVHDGESKASVARDIGVPESTLRGWCKNEDKISYLSRQSTSPDTDESLERAAQSKRPKLDDSSMQPFNLSMKSNGRASYSPTNETVYPYLQNGFAKVESEPAKAPLHLNAKTETPKTTTSEQERNRAELARMGKVLANGTDNFFSRLAGNSADLRDHLNALAQWNTLLMQQQKMPQAGKPKVTAPTTSPQMAASTAGLLTTVDQQKHAVKQLPKEKQSADESIWYWLSQNPTFLNQTGVPNGISTTSATTSSTTPAASMVSANGFDGGMSAEQSAYLWRWYKQFGYTNLQAQFPLTDSKPLLYQHLTKDQQNAENLSASVEVDKSGKASKAGHNKGRTVLDDLFFNNNLVAGDKRNGKEDEEIPSQNEALEHGELFLRWLETCSDPSVTAMQIMQFRTLLNNVRSGGGQEKRRPPK
ncbi:hypothetical protein NQ318_018725 [Aromia moschata]|uniref:HTH psq-type domain-containing protein n=1 Tax=Aromia moschata TaxID=1265417 RepID=A0AAV8ZHN0_9CUCU|nr:hypothetical protein NQ318_018725 [Aromia moschata]